MALDRYPATVALLLCLAVGGCDGSHSTAAQQATTPVTTPPPATTASPPATTASQPATTQPTSRRPGTSAPASSSVATRPSAPITIPAYLCSGTDAAQNAADAYMGALSAGNAAEAQACVLPSTVPVSLTRSLLATGTGTAVYLPRDGVDGPSVFGYQGNGKIIDVTVGKQSDGEFRVIKVAVRTG